VGKRSEFEARPRGFYPTPWAAFVPLIPHIRQGTRVAELCAGNGALCGHLYNAGFIVQKASDIKPDHPLVAQRDALDITEADLANVELIVTNPPWPEPRRHGEPTMALLKHFVRLRPTWLLLPADFMHNAYAAEAIGHCAHIVSVGRVRWMEGTKHDGKDNCCWYQFFNFSNGGVLSFTPRR
jgi:hypothetical protein